MVQWLRCGAPNAGGPDSIPGQGTRFCLTQLKILRTATKIHVPQLRRGIVKEKIILKIKRVRDYHLWRTVSTHEFTQIQIHFQ